VSGGGVKEGYFKVRFSELGIILSGAIMKFLAASRVMVRRISSEWWCVKEVYFKVRFSEL